MDFFEKITIITGHYGAGKTNFAINLALWAKQSGRTVTIADLDIVNPYFRTADYKKLFDHSVIRLAASDFAGSSLDIPAINLDIRGEINRSDRLIIDVGGDGEGAKALGRFAPVLEQAGYEMIYVINRCRHLTPSAEQAVELMRGIEKASGLKCTKIFNNSNLGSETTAEIIAESAPFAEEVSKLTGLPLIAFPVKIYVKPVWEV